MASILLGWEFGSGLGHIALLRPIGRALLAAGHRVVLATGDPSAAAHAGGLDGMDLLKGPSWPIPRDPKVRAKATATLADILVKIDFHNANRLVPMTRAWESTLIETRAELVVAEFAPTLALAASGRLPTVTVGTGFSVPPRMAPLPAIRPGAGVPRESRENEQRLIGAVQETRRELELAPLSSLADLFSTERSFVCTLPELDHYGTFRSGQIGPLDPGPDVLQRIRPQAVPAGRRAFAYLSGQYPVSRHVAEAMSDAGFECEAYVRDLAEPARAAFDLPGFHRHDRPQPLESVLPGMAVLVHHGGISTCHLALYAGVPQVLVPNMLEQRMTARRLEGLGVAVCVEAPAAEARRAVAAAADRVAGDPSYRSAAQALAADLANRGDPAAVEVVARACRDLLAA